MQKEMVIKYLEKSSRMNRTRRSKKSTVAKNIFIFTKCSESNKMDLHYSLKDVRYTKRAGRIVINL